MHYFTTAPDDYSLAVVQAAQLSFASVTNRSCVSIAIVDDDDLEPPENFSVVITTSDPDVKVNPDTAVFIIYDDDSKCFDRLVL